MATRGATDGGNSLPGGRSLFGVTFVHSIVEWSAWITVLVVAFQSGGAAATGLVVAVQLVPAALLAPVVTAAGDRFPRHVVLSVGFAVLAVSAAAIALALATDLPLGVVYACAAVFTVALVSTPGAVASLLVHHARSPMQLMNWNVGQSLMRAGGSLVGPAITAVLLAVTEPAIVFGAIAVTCALTAATIQARLPHDDRPTSTLRLRSILTDSIDGIRYVTTDRNPRRVIGFIAVTGLLVGAFDVVFVAVAFDQLGRGGSASAALTAAFAVGALAASVAVSRRLRWRLTTLTTIGVLLLSIPLIALGVPTRLLPVLVLVALLGSGNTFVEIGTHTMLQRVCTETMTSRAFGAKDSALLVAASIGAGLAGLVIADNDLTSVLALLGAGAAVVLVALSFGLRRAELAPPTTADVAMVDTLRTISFLEPLPLPTLERLVRGLEHREVAAGCCVIAEGDHGSEFFILLEGAADITIVGDLADRVVAPASFGEIALLHDSPRQATVTVTEPSRLAVIQRADFLEAIRRSATSHQTALAVAQSYRSRNDS
jgi:MFS family permease